MSHPLDVPAKPAVPPGASLAYNHAGAHVSPLAPTTCVLLRPGLRKQAHAASSEAPATPTLAVRPGPVEGRVPHLRAAPCASTSAARTEEGSEAAPRDHAPAAASAGAAATGAHPDPRQGDDPDPHLGIPPDPHPATGPAALRCAIAHCGGQSALASAIGLSQSHVWNWLNRRSIPAEHCPAIERATDRAVRCEALRPDVDWAYLRAVCEELASVRDEA